MADASVAELIDLLLADDPSSEGASLVHALAADPPLLLWVVCAARGDDAFRPACLADVARWLGEHAAEVFGAAVGVVGPGAESPGGLPEEWADRVAHAVARADLVERLAADETPEAVDSAYLYGLLADAADWLVAAGPPGGKAGAGCLPAWLATVPPPVDALIGRAVRILVPGDAAGDAEAIDVEACRRRGAQARESWLSLADGPADWLPRLAAKLLRLATLETRFQQQLETEKLEAIAEFAAGAGHEINNPLTVIAGRAQLFLRGETDPERRRALALISAQAMRVYEMIADMMLFARPPQPEFKAVDLGRLTDGLIEEIGPEAAKEEIVLRRGGQLGPIEIEADPTQLTVVLRAMCQNACEAIGREGSIGIALAEAGDHVEIRVDDDGPGITPEERAHLFDPYFSARQAGRGLGLGLSKCWRIVTNHHGRIDVASEAGRGATFTIILPRRQPA